MKKPIIVCGRSFAGKTTLADALGAQVDDAALGCADWVRRYAATDERIAGALRAGRAERPEDAIEDATVVGPRSA